ncbi:thiamine ABC transporter substrate binding subunit [Candidatus Curculioniphilus buchneri]|uniref:thiamine ABC transporter substrate binding subunit n=1 Tax=Candidatus Curculioniphilus buchneri TaxID=690594 RepID=UPI00376F182E
MLTKKWLFCLLLTFSTSILAKSTLTIYTYHAFSSEWGPRREIQNAFEKKYDCKLKFITLEDGIDLLNRLRIEGHNSQADVVIGLDNNLIQAARETDLFAPHDINIQNLKLPGGWNDKIFLPYDYSYFAFIYDKRKLQNPPRSMNELINNHSSMKIIYPDPRSSTAGLGLLLWMQKIYGNNNASDAFKKLSKKTLTITKSWSGAYNLFLKGEADIVLSYITSPAYHIIKENKDYYVAACFSDGHYQQVEVAAQLKISKKADLANLFMQFILTPDFQKNIYTKSWMYPVIDIPLPIGFKKPPRKIVSFTPKQIATERVSWIKDWQKAVSV